MNVKRVWNRWKLSISTSLVIFLVVFIIALNVEVQHKREGGTGVSVHFFHSTLTPSLSIEDSEYSVTITNDQTYTIASVEVDFSGTEFSSLPGSSTTHEGSVAPESEVLFPHSVVPGTTTMDITLQGDGFGVLTNIDMYLQSPNGTRLEYSSGDGNQESIQMTEEEIRSAGYGEYVVVVTHESGIMSVDFQLVVDITHGPAIVTVSSDDHLLPGQSLTMDLTFGLKEGDIADVICTIHSTILLSDGGMVTIERVYDSSWAIIEEDLPSSEEGLDSEPWGPVDLTGTFSLLFIISSAVLTFLYYNVGRTLRPGKKNVLEGSYIFILLLGFVFAMDHTLVALQKDWLWLSPGMLFSYIALALLLCFTIYTMVVVGGHRSGEARKIGKGQIVLIMGIVITILLHIGLMGDHLGFLK